MRLSVCAVVVTISLLLTSCFNITETIDVKKDGSGNYILLFDMSSMMRNPMMAAMMQSGEGENKMTDQDTTIYFRHLKDSVDAAYSRAMEKLSMRLISSEKDSQLMIRIQYPFDDTEDLNTMFLALEEVGKRDGENEALGLLGGGQGMATAGTKFSSGKKSFTRIAEEPPANISMEDQKDMMEMMMGEAFYMLNYTMPGKIKKTTIPNAIISGNKLVAKASMMELLQRKVLLSGEIRYK